MTQIEVELGERSYRIDIGDGALGSSAAAFRSAGLSAGPVIVTNSRVWRLHGTSLAKALGRELAPRGVIRIGDGEGFKHLGTLQRIWQGLFRLDADRRSWILAFGGGVVGDIAGFAAATFQRGIAYVNVPTTLLAQVDSAVGGKVAINVPQGKNLIGAFHQPAAVVSDIRLLGTLPPRELASGLFEVVKCGAIRSEKLLSFIELELPRILSCRPAALERLVAESCRIKAAVVSSDEQEGGQRMILNYGHTVGHALEAATGYRRFRHGEAVAWGMIAAAGFARQLGMMTAAEARRLCSLLHRVRRLPSLKGVPVEAVWRALGRDKKFRAGEIRMVLLPELGSAEVVASIEPAQLKSYLDKFLAGGGAPLL